MKLIIISILAFIGGVFLAIQAGFNTKLGIITKQPLLPVISTSITSVVLGSFLLFLTNNKIVSLDIIKQVPRYLWFIGGMFSVIGISLYFYTIPKLGISRMIALGLCGQLLFSVIAGKYGWFNLPTEPLTIRRILGICCLVLSIFLINSK